MYIALLSDKLFVSFVKLAGNYTNQCVAKDGVVANLDMDDLSRAIGTFNNIFKEVKKHVDYDKHWVDYPGFFSLPPDASPKGYNKRVKLLPPADPTTPTVGGGGAGCGGSPGCGNGNAGRGGGRGTGRGGGVNTWVTGAGFGAGSFQDTSGLRVRNDKGCYVLLGSTRDPARTLCSKVREQYCTNTPPMVFSATISPVLQSTDGLTTTQLTSKPRSWPMSRHTRLWSCSLLTVIPR